MPPGPSRLRQGRYPGELKAAGRGGQGPPATVEGCRPQHRTATMKDQAALNRFLEL